MDTDNQVKNQEVNANEDASGNEKTFTQADVNRIVAERVSDFKDYDELKAKAAKYDEAEEANKTELEKAQEKNAALQKELDALKSAAELQKMHEEVSKESGVPAELLTASTKDECIAQAEKIKAYAKPDYPQVKDAGEPHATAKRSTREQFADWMDNQK